MAKTKISKAEIRELGLEAIKNYFQIEPSKLDKNVLTHLHQMAKMGMQFEKEMNLNERSVEKNYIRVFSMIASDKKELKKYIKKSMPNYIKE